MDISSYTAASTLPKKLLIDGYLIEDIKLHDIYPIHIQLNPTNKCPLNCSFCSCKNRDKEDVMSLELMEETIDKFHFMNTKAITITGGGDPLAYPYLKELIEYSIEKNMKLGLVTNGVLFNTIDLNILKNLTWCRVSVSDEQVLLKTVMEKVIKTAPNVDWAFSYVLNSEKININLINCINFANEHNFTHIRLVDNILTNKSSVDYIKQFITEIGIDDSRVIYQGRKKYTKGNKRCLISLLKPNIDPNGNMLPCCGIQYAFEDLSYDFDKRAIMNKDKSIEDIYKDQSYFDGSNCVKCYYSEYNDIMNIIWDGENTKHIEFV